MRMLKLLIPLLFFSLALDAQDPKLAQQYFQDGEYEKAGALFEDLYKKNNGNEFYFNQYIECLIYQEKFTDCEKIVKKRIKKKPNQIELYVTYGNLFEKQYKDEEAKEQYEKAIKKLPADRFPITKLASAFSRLQKYDLAIQAYEKGAKLLKNKHIFAYNLGDLYRRKGDNPKMIESYLNSLDDNPSRLNTTKTLFERYLHEDDYFELQSQLYTRIQEDTEKTHFPELLTWVFIHNKDYKSAFRQVKALDRQMDENGGRVFRLAEIASNDKDYETAIEAYDYIVAEKGLASTFYIEAKRESLSCKREKLIAGYDYTEADLRDLELQYYEFLEEFGSSKITAVIIAELADLEAFYLKDLDKAIALLLEMVEYPGLKSTVKAEGKISLADFYLMKGEIWEATLLYSQVDKAFKDDILGHQARFRNAKLSYYSGDFQWAQTQFDVLKASTSKLIANDALDLSIFILDNLGLDTTTTALSLFAQADLLVFQNRFDDAFLKLDTIKNDFPKHSLEDDIYYTKSTIYLKKREYVKSAEMLQKIIDDYSDGIRGDNALFDLAELYEHQLNDTEKAKALYEKIFIDYSGSTFAVEARKRYRKLRGDEI